MPVSPPENWNEKDIATASILYSQGSDFSAIARTLGNHTKSGTRYILIKRGFAPVNGKVKTEQALLSGVKTRYCVRCREEFQPLSKYLFTCNACKDSKEFRTADSTIW